MQSESQSESKSQPQSQPQSASNPQISQPQPQPQPQPTPLILYSYFRSSTSWRVRIALHYKNIPHQYRYIHLVKGQQKSQEYKKINPNAAVPALVLGNGQVLIQSVAIIQYLEEVYPERPLYPKDPVLKAQIRGFCQVINSGLHPYQNLRLLQKLSTDFKADKIQWCKQWLKKGLETLETMLKKTRGKYCFGDQITAADIFFVPHVQGGTTRFGVGLEEYPNVREVLGNLQEVGEFGKGEPKNQEDYQK